MSEVKLLYGNLPTITRTDVYVAPAGKYAIAKSILIANRSSTPSTFILFIGNTCIGNRHVLAPNQTLLIDDLTIPMLPGQVISASAGATSTIMMWITGEEVPYDPSNYPYASSYGVVQITVSPLINLNVNNDWILKSLVLSNNNGTDRSFSLYLISPGRTTFYVIATMVLKAYDSLILPLPNLMIPKGYSLDARIDGSVTDIWYGVTCMKVNN